MHEKKFFRMALLLLRSISRGTTNQHSMQEVAESDNKSYESGADSTALLSNIPSSGTNGENYSDFRVFEQDFMDQAGCLRY